VAETSGLLNRRRGITPTEGSNPSVSARARWRPYLAIAAFALLLTLPAILAPIKLHDSFWIDWVWTDQFAAQLRAGILYPRWLPASHDGLGAPVFYYYPPLSFYPAGLLAALGASPYAAIVATFGLGFAGSGAAMYRWAEGWTNHPLAAALLFMAAPYHLVDFYGRGALAEFCAIAFIPLLALGLKRVSEGRGIALLAVAYAAMIATHLPLALLASLFLILPYALVLSRRRPRALPGFAPPLALGIGLAAIYLIPALALERYRDAAVLWSDQVLRPDHWLLVNGIRSDPLTGMGLISLKVIAVIALPALFLALRRRSGWAGYAIACCLVVAGLLPFFWSLPLIRSVQFPFRALPFAEFGLATALALAPRGERIAALLALPALALSAIFLLSPAPGGAPVALAELAGRHPDVPENLPPGARPYSWPSRWALDLAERHRSVIRQGDVTVEPLFYFPAWRVTCAGGEVEPFPDPATGLLAHRGTECRATLGWTAPEKAGAALSLLALLLLLALLFRARARRDAPC
jgi:6-pyruvoyl-tetrahydropterin synthase related domain